MDSSHGLLRFAPSYEKISRLKSDGYVHVPIREQVRNFRQQKKPSVYVENTQTNGSRVCLISQERS